MKIEIVSGAVPQLYLKTLFELSRTTNVQLIAAIHSHLVDGMTQEMSAQKHGVSRTSISKKLVKLRAANNTAGKLWYVALQLNMNMSQDLSEHCQSQLVQRNTT